jgi:uncharacterized repeat protein (TIGR03987 family)
MEKSVMPTIIIIAVISITAALIFYSIAVWWNWLTKRLQPRQLVLFYLGLACDILATGMMKSSVAEVTYDLHTISGYTALALMLSVTVTGTYATLRHDDRILENFHKFGLPIWFIWVVSWLTGVVLGIQKF